MAKRKLAKSTKRTVRRTIAALLMVSALIVAAIPGQGINAEEDLEDIEDIEVYGDEAYEEYNSDYDEYEESYEDGESYDDYEVVNGDDVENVGTYDPVVDANIYIYGGLKYEIDGNGILWSIKAATNDDYGSWRDEWIETNYEYVVDLPDGTKSTSTSVSSSLKESSTTKDAYLNLKKALDYTEINIPPAGTQIVTNNGEIIDFPAVKKVGGGTNPLYSYEEFSNVISLNLTTDVETIKENALKDNVKLQSVGNMPYVTDIKDNAFDGCTSLRSIASSNVKNIGTNAFRGCEQLANFGDSSKVETINNNAFEDCVSLASFNFTSLIESGLSQEAFKHSGLRTVDMTGSNNIKMIPDRCFLNCESLSSVKLPQNVTEVGSYAFSIHNNPELGTDYYSALTTIDMPGVEIIGNGAFSDCEKLNNMSAMDKLRVVGDRAFENCVSLSTVTLPASLNTLGSYAFNGCERLGKLIILPADGDCTSENKGSDKTALRIIPEYAFANCPNIQDVDIPEGVSSIADTAFEHDSSIKRVSLPSTLNSLAEETFNDMPHIEDVYIYNDNLDMGSSMSAFYSVDPRNFAIHGNLSTPSGDYSTAYKFAQANGYVFESLQGEVQEACFRVDKNGTLTYVNVDALIMSSGYDIVVPQTVDGITVKSIADSPSVFRGCAPITSVKLPSTVTDIADYAFADCKSLLKIAIPNPDCTIGDNTFNNDSKLVIAGEIADDSNPFLYAMNKSIPYVTDKDDDYRVENINGVNTLVRYNNNLSDLVIPTGVEAFGKKSDGSSNLSGIFEGNDKLQTIRIEGINTLHDHEFFNCKNLSEVILPDTLENIGMAPFYGCDKLENVNISNSRYDCEDGILYDNAKAKHQRIIEVLPGAAKPILTLDEPVAELADEACASNKKLGQVIVYDGIKTIPYRCFAESSVMLINLMDSGVRTIETKAFENANNLIEMDVPECTTTMLSPSDDDLSNDTQVVTVKGYLGSTAESWANRNNQLVFEKYKGGDSSSSSSSSTSSSSSSSSSNSSSNKSSSGKNNSSSKKKSNSSSKKSSGSSSSSSSGSSSSSNSSSELSNVIVVENDPNASNRDNVGNAKVDAGDSGLDDQDLISGSIDGDNAENYMIRITQTEEATAEFENALRGKYGSLDALEYFPMDISLYDKSGTQKIENPQGVSVTITIPIPEDLSAYGGNNKVGAVANSSLETLDTRFSNINDRNCVTFTATHFSPYGIYVDTDNLSADDMLDASPKTGDPISPKWFISLALAAMSLLLFFKKDTPVRNPVKA